MDKSKNRIGAVLLILIVSAVPLIVSAAAYEIGLKEYPWFSGADQTYDFFLYWKGQALILLCGLLALYVGIKQIFCGEDWMSKLRGKYMAPLGLYLVFVILSTVFSSHREMAVWGGYEQWEGMIVIAAYVVVLFMACLIVGSGTELKMIQWGFLAGAFLMSLLGACQAFGHDFFRTENGQAVMNFMVEKKLKFDFNFEKGRVFATLYNPNYVGSYVALALPVVLSFLSRRRELSRLVMTAVSGVTGVFLIIMLFGSESVTGFIGLLAGFVLFCVFFAARSRENIGRFFAFAGVCLVAIAAAVWFNRPVFEYGLNKITHPTPNSFVVRSMEAKEGALYMTTAEDQTVRLTVSVQDGTFCYEAAAADGTAVVLNRNESTGKWSFSDPRFSGILLRETTVVAEGDEKPAFVVETPSVNKSYTVVPEAKGEDGGVSYRFYNIYKKLDRLRYIPAVGFEKNQHFGSRRGYIWSRTFPLLSENILLGSGPNTFVYEFPNDDYVGMINVGYDGATVTKPHNMYLQIWMQTGLLSLIAYLALYLIYFVESVRMYLKKPSYSRGDIFGIGLLIGTFGYQVTGLANDSCVAVAPVYWCLLGIGIAVNRINHKAELSGEQGE